MRPGVVMVQQEALSSVLSDFARTLTTDFPIQGILDHLVVRIVDVLPVSAAGVTLVSAGTAPHHIAASDDSALRFVRLQTAVGEGPCLSACTTGSSVSVPDLAADGRFPRFGPLAVAAGLAAVWTFPLRHGDGRLGALDLYHDRSGGLAQDDMDAAQTLADVAAAYLLNAQARDDARAVSEGYRHSSLHDPLTGLPNRALLEQRMAHAAQRARRSHTVAALLFADLDRFKSVNDTYGHRAGDQLLLAVAERLSHLVRPGDTLARVSGDEFVFLCEDLHEAADAQLLAQRIDDAFVPPFPIGQVEIAMSATVGMAFAGRGEAITPQLLVDADHAMYRAKRARGRRAPELPPAVAWEDRTTLVRDLRRAVAQQRLAVHYQPVVALPDGRLKGVEALLRWEDPVRGAVAPAEVVAVAEETGLIHEIGAWVLERACRDRGRWLRAHPTTPLDVAVNVSGRQLRRPDFLTDVLSTLTRTGTDPAAVVLEITENVLVEDSVRVVEVFTALRAIGVRLALDDFGTGYSSLSYLRRLPVDIVKIDRAFVADIGADETAGAVVAAITRLAHVMGLSVVAEGVETEEQRLELAAAGCEAAQGFIFSRPVPAGEIVHLLAGAVGTSARCSGAGPVDAAQPSFEEAPLDLVLGEQQRLGVGVPSLGQATQPTEQVRPGRRQVAVAGELGLVGQDVERVEPRGRAVGEPDRDGPVERHHR